MVPIVPSLCLLLAVVFHRFLEQRSPGRIVAAVLLALMLIAGLTQAEIQFYLRQRNAAAKMVHGEIKVRVPEKNIADGKRVAEELGALRREGTKIVLVKPVQPSGRLALRLVFSLSRESAVSGRKIVGSRTSRGSASAAGARPLRCARPSRPSRRLRH